MTKRQERLRIIEGVLETNVFKHKYVNRESLGHWIVIKFDVTLRTAYDYIDTCVRKLDYKCVDNEIFK